MPFKSEDNQGSYQKSYQFKKYSLRKIVTGFSKTNNKKN